MQQVAGAFDEPLYFLLGQNVPQAGCVANTTGSDSGSLRACAKVGRKRSEDGISNRRLS
jgi:hypothetical protein